MVTDKAVELTPEQSELAYTHCKRGIFIGVGLCVTIFVVGIVLRAALLT